MQTAGESQENMAALQKVLGPMRVTIQDQSFLGGEEPNFADFAVAGAFAVRLSLIWVPSLFVLALSCCQVKLLHKHDYSIQMSAFIRANKKGARCWCYQ